jgi:hypothetical protein
MFYFTFFLFSIVVNLTCAFAWISIGLFGMGLLFVTAAAVSLIGMFYSAYADQ